MENQREMYYEMLVGLNVINDDKYNEYRNNMIPILQSYGGEFGYDFKISEVLRSETEDDINRLFTIRFPDKGRMEDFFSDPDYKKVKEQYFKGSVISTTIISSYMK